jgi:hypothetical protein
MDDSFDKVPDEEVTDKSPKADGEANHEETA